MEILSGLLTGVIVLVCLTLFCYLIGRIMIDSKTGMDFKGITTMGVLYLILMLFLALFLTIIVVLGIWINKTFFK